MSTKIHAMTEGLGRCVDFILTEGQVHESTQAEKLFLGKTLNNLLADKGYDSDRIRNLIDEMGGIEYFHKLRERF